MSPVLITRQDDPEREVVFIDDDPSWWNTETAVIVKWAILGGIILIFVLWFVVGYWHAKRRLRKNLLPLKYHRFLVPHQYRKRTPANQNDFSFYNGQEYQMNNMPPPPPMYDPSAPMPPTYQPADSGSKISPNQAYDAPPPGNPPRQQTPQEETELPPRQEQGLSLASKATKILNKFGRK